MEETDPIVNELKVTQANSIRNDAKVVLQGFLNDQREILENIAKHADTSSEELAELFGADDREDRHRVVESRGHAEQIRKDRAGENQNLGNESDGRPGLECRAGCRI